MVISPLSVTPHDIAAIHVSAKHEPNITKQRTARRPEKTRMANVADNFFIIMHMQAVFK